MKSCHGHHPDPIDCPFWFTPPATPAAGPGSPEAFLTATDSLYAAVEVDGTTGIYRSTDAGRTWDLRYRDRA